MAITVPKIGAGYRVRDIKDENGNPIIVNIVDRFGQPTGSTEESQMLEAVDGTIGFQNSKWHTCPVCGEAFPETEMNFIRGKWYSLRYNCAQDVASDPKVKPIDNRQTEHLSQFDYVDISE
jgi:hypothetical protein